MGVEQLRIIQIEHPLSYPGDNQWLQDGCYRVQLAHYLDVTGNNDWVNGVDDAVVRFNNEDHVLRRWWCGVLGSEGDPDSVVAVARCDLFKRDDKIVDIEVAVHPKHRRRGIGTALLRHIETHPDVAGRTVLLNTEGEFSAADDLGEQMSSPTGGGGAPISTPGLQFALKHGYALEQVERLSICALPVDPELLEELVIGSGTKAAGYRTVTWLGPVPPEYLDGYAALMTEIVRDAPTGDLQLGEDIWDAERLAQADQTLIARGFVSLITVAQHEATGELAAMTMIKWQPAKPTFGFQEGTVVLRAHRGRHLGMLIKALNLQALTVENPLCERLYTTNAEENDRMLAINDELGYVPFGGNCVFQKLR